MRVLVVDDEKYRHDFFKKAYNTLDDVLIQAYDYDNAILEISSTPYDFDVMFLDHDLSDAATMKDPGSHYEKTGSDIAEYMVREVEAAKCGKMKIYVHSMNPVGRSNMVKILKKAGFNVINAPFNTLQLSYG